MWQQGVWGFGRSRSEPDISRRGLTTATQHLVRAPTSSNQVFDAGVWEERPPTSFPTAVPCSPGTRTALVRFLGQRPIKPHVPPLVQASPVPMIFSLAAVRPQAGHLTRELRPRPVGPAQDQCPSFTARTTRVSNPDRSPGFRSPQRQERPRELPSPLVFLPISTHFTATPEIPLSSTALQIGSIERGSPVGPRDFTPDFPIRLRTLYAQ